MYRLAGDGVVMKECELARGSIYVYVYVERERERRSRVIQTKDSEV